MIYYCLMIVVIFFTHVTHIFEITLKSLKFKVIKLRPVNLMGKPLGVQRHHDLHSCLKILYVGVVFLQVSVFSKADDDVLDVQGLVKVGDDMIPASVPHKKGPRTGDCSQSVHGCLTINDPMIERKTRV